MARDAKQTPAAVNTSRDLGGGQSLSQSSPLSPKNNDSSGDTGSPPSPNPAASGSHSQPHKLPQQASARLKALKKSSRLKEVATQTRNEIRKHIRQDWQWPVDSTAATAAGNTRRTNGDIPSDILPDANDHTNHPDVPRNAWTSRINDETLFLERDPGSEPESDFEEDNRLAEEAKDGVKAPDFKYESPESVQETADAEVSIRWRRLESRRRLYVDELRENAGLRYFEARRNAWTGAILAPRLSDRKSYIRDRNVRFKRLDPLDTSPDGPYEFPTRQSLKQRVMEMKRKKVVDNSIDGGVDVDADNENDVDDDDRNDEEAERAVSGTDPETLLQDENLIPYVPIAPPLIDPDNEIRAEIRESTYQHIYSKVVVQGTTPSVPVNLKDMTRALVAGWKADDEWPPKPSILDPLVGRRKGRGGAQAGKGKESSWLKKVLRITGGRDDPTEVPGLIGG